MSSELVSALRDWDTYDPNISEEKVLRQANAVIDAARPLPARIEALEAENAQLWETLGKMVALYESEYDPDFMPPRPVWLQETIAARRAREGDNDG